MLFLNYKLNIKKSYDYTALQGGISAKYVPIAIPSIRTITIATKKIIAPTIYNSNFDFVSEDLFFQKKVRTLFN